MRDQAVDQPGQRRLASAGLSAEQDGFAILDCQIDMVQVILGFSALISKGNIFQFDHGITSLPRTEKVCGEQCGSGNQHR